MRKTTPCPSTPCNDLSSTDWPNSPACRRRAFTMPPMAVPCPPSLCLGVRCVGLCPPDRSLWPGLCVWRFQPCKAHPHVVSNYGALDDILMRSGGSPWQRPCPKAAPKASRASASVCLMAARSASRAASRWPTEARGVGLARADLCRTPGGTAWSTRLRLSGWRHCADTVHYQSSPAGRG